VTASSDIYRQRKTEVLWGKKVRPAKIPYEVALDRPWVLGVKEQGLIIWGVKKKEESRIGPSVAQWVPVGVGSRISWHLVREGGEVVSLTHRPPLPPGVFLVLIFTRGWVDPRAMARSEGDVTEKSSDTTGNGLVAQRLNHYATPDTNHLRLGKLKMNV
jgi:hypothetical protein